MRRMRARCIMSNAFFAHQIIKYHPASNGGGMALFAARARAARQLHQRRSCERVLAYLQRASSSGRDDDTIWVSLRGVHSPLWLGHYFLSLPPLFALPARQRTRGISRAHRHGGMARGMALAQRCLYGSDGSWRTIMKKRGGVTARRGVS